MLFFLGIFAISGLFLNHYMDWFHEPPDKNKKKVTRTITQPRTEDPQEMDEALAAQLGLSGEIIRGRQPPKNGHVRFSVHQVSQILGVDADLNAGQATITFTPHSFSGFLMDAHTFSGARRLWREDPPVRDWWMTKVWSVSMDAVAVGILLLALTSLYMWFQLKKKRRLGLAVLCAGILSCSVFLWGLRSLF